MRKKYVCTEPTQAWLAGSISILHQFFNWDDYIHENGQQAKVLPTHSECGSIK